jgi:hypothetical protein
MCFRSVVVFRSFFRSTGLAHTHTIKQSSNQSNQIKSNKQKVPLFSEAKQEAEEKMQNSRGGEGRLFFSFHRGLFRSVGSPSSFADVRVSLSLSHTLALVVVGDSW